MVSVQELDEAWLEHRATLGQAYMESVRRGYDLVGDLMTRIYGEDETEGRMNLVAEYLFLNDDIRKEMQRFEEVRASLRGPVVGGP